LGLQGRGGLLKLGCQVFAVPAPGGLEFNEGQIIGCKEFIEVGLSIDLHNVIARLIKI